MNILVAYDSLYGNTEKIAKAIGDGLAGNEVKVIAAKDATPELVKNIDLIVAGSPTHGGRSSENMQTFLKKIPDNSLQNLKAASFDTGMIQEGQNFLVKSIVKFFGYAAKRIAAQLKQKGADLIASETFLVLGKEGPLKDGEIERAKEWGRKLIKNE